MQHAEINLDDFGTTNFFSAVGLPKPQLSLPYITAWGTILKSAGQVALYARTIPGALVLKLARPQSCGGSNMSLLSYCRQR